MPNAVQLAEGGGYPGVSGVQWGGFVLFSFLLVFFSFSEPTNGSFFRTCSMSQQHLLTVAAPLDTPVTLIQISHDFSECRFLGGVVSTSNSSGQKFRGVSRANFEQ